jgi:hypothetical protein
MRRLFFRTFNSFVGDINITSESFSYSTITIGTEYVWTFIVGEGDYPGDDLSTFAELLPNEYGVASIVISSGTPYTLQMDVQMNFNNSAGLTGQVLTSSGENRIPKWANAPTPTAGSLIKVTTNNIISVKNSYYSQDYKTLAIGAVLSTNSSINSSNNTSFGQDAMAYLYLDAQTGSYMFNGGYGTAIGVNALGGASTIDGDTAVGAYTLTYNLQGQNTAVGNNALNYNTGFANTAIGSYSMGSCSANYNIGIGSGSIPHPAGNFNIGIGTQTLNSLTTGTNNIAIGYRAAYSISTTSNNTAIGNLALNTSTYTNTTGIGYQAAVTNNNQVQLGNSGTTTYVYGTVQNRSDLRDKTQIRDTVLGLDFITQLRPVDFKWNFREDYIDYVEQETIIPEHTEEKEVVYKNADGSTSTKIVTETIPETKKIDLISFNVANDGSRARSRYHHGLIAQEVKSLTTDLGIDFGGYQDHLVSGGKDVQSIGYDELIAPLIKSIQELNAITTAQAILIEQLNARLLALEPV